MNLNDYQAHARRTMPTSRDPKSIYQHMILGLLGELGEVTDLLKKHIHHMHDLNKPKLRQELGDLLWYVSNLADTAEIPLDDVATHNIAKLQERYPQGFDPERSRYRKELS